MKKSILLIAVLATVFSCNKQTEDPKPTCQPDKVTMVANGTTVFTFNDDGTINKIEVDPGTDSASVYNYTWQDGKLSKISNTEDGVTFNFTPVYDGNDIIKFQSDGGYEIRMEYGGGRMTQRTDWIRGQKTGEYFQFAHYKYSYDGSGNLTKSENYFDFDRLFVLLAGNEPTNPYNPVLLFTISMAYTGTTGTNPLSKTWFLEDFTFSLANNFPSKITLTDEEGNIGTENFSITLNDQGYPEKMESANVKVDVVYNCN